ncbi:MAG: 2,3-diaminopropionate biosynthesis protein SbnA [Pseudonocardia sp.]
MIYQSVRDIVLDDIFLDLPGLIPDVRLILKIEGLNPAGSIKLKPAIALVSNLEAEGLITGGSKLIESSSGNLGIALGVACAAKGYRLTLVTDPNASRHAIRIMRALGVNVVEVTEKDDNGGYLQSRIDYIYDQMNRDPELIWLNQYANSANVRTHRDRTALRLHRELSPIDAVVVGVGTSGTLMGCVEYFAEHSPATRIVAVDAEGSVTFGGRPGRRRIPGLGASRRPELFRDTGTFEKMMVPEIETIGMCRRVASQFGLLVGGSTGTALAAAARVASSLSPGARVAVVSPDLGEKYVETIYSDEWVETHYPRSLRAALSSGG